jgi:hypothetical protein
MHRQTPDQHMFEELWSGKRADEVFAQKKRGDLQALRLRAVYWL